MNNVSVIVQDCRVTVVNLTIDNREVSAYFGRIDEADRPKAFGSAVEVGVAILERFESRREMDYVRQQADSILAAVSSAAEAVPARVQEELLLTLGTQDGQALAPVAGLVRQTERVVNDKLDQVRTLINDHIDPSRSDSTFGRALDSVKKLLDPKHDDSVQKTFERAVNGVTGADGSLAQLVKRIISETLEPLKERVDQLTREIHGQEAVAEALEQTTAKGRPFEEELLAVVQPWAEVVGAEVDHVGPDNLPGDILVVMDPSGLAMDDLRIIIEARDDNSAKGRKRILDDMATAMATRKAAYGIYVARTTGALAKEIGDWAELQCQHGSVIACTAEHLRTALRFALVQRRIRQLKAATPEADIDGVEVEVARIRTILGRVRNINTKASAVRSSADEIKDEATELKREISEALTTIEEALHAGPVVAASSDGMAQAV